MKDYTYISDTKVDWFFGQAPLPWRKRVAIELGLDFKVLDVKLTP